MKDLHHGQYDFNRMLGFLTVAAVGAAMSFVIAWAVRLHTVHDFNVTLCRQQEQQNHALRLVLQARLDDPGTPAKVKQEFRYVMVQYLQPANCNGLP